MPLELKEALERLNDLPVSSAEKDALADILKTAANPNAERLDVIIAGLPDDRRKLVEDTAKAVGAITNDVVTRGSKALMEMSDEEWQALIDADEQSN